MTAATHFEPRDCPRCAEPVAADAPACGFCGHALAPRRHAALRLGEIASLAAALVLIVLVCRVLGRLIGV